MSAIDMMLQYNTEFLSVLTVENAVNTALNLNQIETTIDHEKGTILYGAFKLTRPWPTVSFELVRMEFIALSPSESTTIKHIIEGNPKTIMAHAGENTMKAAPDITIHILPPIQHSDSIGKNNAQPSELMLSCDESLHQCSVELKSMITGHTSITVNQGDGAFKKILFENSAQQNETYHFGFDTSVLPPGQYLLQMESSDTKLSRKFSISN